MRCILCSAWVLGFLVSAAGCADLLGIEAWQDPANTGGSAGAGAKEGEDDDAGPGGGGGGAGGGTGCNSGTQDGEETDIDCGGPACPACLDGAACTASEDCESSFCSARQICAPVDGRTQCGVEDPNGATCGDCIKNGEETDLDCGGDACNPCRQGKACLNDADCLGGACVGDQCALGGPGVDCLSNADCASGVCAGGALTEGACQ